MEKSGSQNELNEWSEWMDERFELKCRWKNEFVVTIQYVIKYKLLLLSISLWELNPSMWLNLIFQFLQTQFYFSKDFHTKDIFQLLLSLHSFLHFKILNCKSCDLEIIIRNIICSIFELVTFSCNFLTCHSSANCARWQEETSNSLKCPHVSFVISFLGEVLC